MLPIIIAQLVVLLKDTALGYIVSSADLITIGRRLANFFGAGQYALSMFFVMLAIYLALNLTLSWIARFVSRQVAKPRKGGKNLDGTKTAPLQLSTQAMRVQHERDDADQTPPPPRP
jgi:glutamate transport system permease protein